MTVEHRAQRGRLDARRRLFFEQMEERCLLAGIAGLSDELAEESPSDPANAIVSEGCEESALEWGEGVRVVSCIDGRVVLEMNGESTVLFSTSTTGFDDLEAWLEWYGEQVPLVSNNADHSGADPSFEQDSLQFDNWGNPIVDAGQNAATSNNPSPVAPPNNLDDAVASRDKHSSTAPSGSFQSSLGGATTGDASRFAIALPTATNSAATANSSTESLFTPLRFDDSSTGGTMAGTPSALVATNASPGGRFDATSAPRRLNWSLRNETLGERDQTATRMTVWAGRIDDAIPPLVAAQADAGGSTDARSSTSRSLAAWREAARRNAPPAVITEAEAAVGPWAARTVGGVAGTHAVTRDVGSRSSRPVEKVTLDAAVGSSLATVQWAKRWVRGAEADAGAQEPTPTEQASGETEQVGQRPWAAYLAAVFSLVQIWRDRRRKRQEAAQ